MTEPMPSVPPTVDAVAGVRRSRSDPARRFLVRGAAALASTTALTSLLGFAFWALAARRFASTAVGAAATAVSAMTLIATLGTLGMGTLLTSKLPSMGQRRADLVASAGLLSGLAAGGLAVVATLALPLSFTGLPGTGISAVRGSVGITALFAAGVGLTAVTLVIDQGLLSLLGGGPQLGRNAVVSVTKLAVLMLFAALTHAGALSIFSAWLVGVAISIGVMALWISLRHHIKLHRVRPGFALLKGLHRDAAEHHSLNLALQIPYFAMPVLASATLGAKSAAHFYATLSVAGFVAFVPMALSTSLFASGARGSGSFTDQFRFSLRSSLLACLPAVAFLTLVGGLVLRLFGEEYAEAGRWTLVLLSIGSLPLIVKDHHVSVARVVGRVGREAKLVCGLTAGELAGAAIGAHFGGIVGLAIGWLAVLLGEGLLFLPLVLNAAGGRLPSAAR